MGNLDPLGEKGLVCLVKFSSAAASLKTRLASAAVEPTAPSRLSQRQGAAQPAGVTAYVRQRGIVLTLFRAPRGPHCRAMGAPRVVVVNKKYGWGRGV